MKINLTICGVHELPDQEGKRWTHVVSIWDKRYVDDKSCRDQIMNVAPRADYLFSFFDDTSDATHPDAPLRRDVKRILDFTSSFTPKSKVLMHCRAGVSRSTATAYAILCQHTEPGTEMDNLQIVESMRPIVIHNRLVVQHADQILRRKGLMLLHLNLDP